MRCYCCKFRIVIVFIWLMWFTDDTHTHNKKRVANTNNSDKLNWKHSFFGLKFASITLYNLFYHCFLQLLLKFLYSDRISVLLSFLYSFCLFRVIRCFNLLELQLQETAFWWIHKTKQLNHFWPRCCWIN